MNRSSKLWFSWNLRQEPMALVYFLQIQLYIKKRISVSASRLSWFLILYQLSWARKVFHRDDIQRTHTHWIIWQSFINKSLPHLVSRAQHLRRFYQVVWILILYYWSASSQVHPHCDMPIPTKGQLLDTMLYRGVVLEKWEVISNHAYDGHTYQKEVRTIGWNLWQIEGHEP